MFIDALNQISYGMYVVATKKAGKPVGCIINSCIQVTSTNPSVVISLNKNNYTTTALKSGTSLSLNILSEKTSSNIIGTFGFSSSKDVNKFENFSYTEESSTPILNDVCGYLILKVKQIIDAGTHNLYLCSVENGKQINNDTPMTYNYYKTVIKGKAPKNAPTFVEEKTSSVKVYKCPICGYEYNSDNPSFNDLPEDWVCPICGVPKSIFEEV